MSLSKFLEKDKVVTLWVNQVMYPGIVTEVNEVMSHVTLKSVQYEGLIYHVDIGQITAITVDTRADTVQKLEEQKAAFEKKQKAAADQMRAEAAELEKGE